MKEMKTKLFKKRVPMLFSAMLTLFALLTATLQAAVMPPLLYRSGENNTLYGNYYYGDYQKNEPTRAAKTYELVTNYSSLNTTDNYIIIGEGTVSDNTIYIAMSTDTYYSERRGVTISAPSNNQVSIDATAGDFATYPLAVFKLEQSTNGYYLKCGSNYLYRYKSGSNHFLQLGAEPNLELKGITNNVVNINGSYGSTTYYAQAKPGSTGSTFGLGTSTPTKIYLYKESSASYTVTYNANNATSGTVPTDGNSYTSGATVTVLGNTGNLARTGYVFAGWNTAANGSGVSYSAGSTFSITDNVTLYAQWNELYDITISAAANGTVTTSPAAGTNVATAGTSVTVTATPSDCYEVASVTTTPTTTVTDNGDGTYSFTMPASDVTVNATFSIIQHNVTLASPASGTATLKNNVTNITETVTSSGYSTALTHLDCGGTVTLNITNIGADYSFIGWKLFNSEAYPYTEIGIVSNSTSYTTAVDFKSHFEAVFGQLYTVTCATGLDNGSILCSNNSTTMTVGEGVNVTITATPATGYELASMTYNDGTTNHDITVAGNSGTFSMPAANVTVNATFTKACDHYYYLVEEDLDDWTGEYLIVYTAGNKAFNGGLTGVTGSAVNVGLDVAENNISVSISDKMITRDATTSAACFNIAKYGDYYTIQSASGYFIGKGSTTSGAGMSQATSRSNTYFDHAITYNNGNVDIVSWQGNENGGHIRYNKTSGQARFRYYPKSNSQEPIQLYRKGVMKPVIDPADGSIFMSGMQPVTITAPDGVSTIYYTTDGTEPTTNSTQYTSSFTINTTTTVKAIAVNECGETSFVATALIRSADDDIIMNPLSGTYLAGTEVTIMSPGAFHYTTDGTQPTTSHGTAVSSNSATIILDSTMTIWAVLDSDDTKNAKENYVVPTGTYEGNNPDGIVMNKSVSGNFSNSGAADYGTGNITLESYVTGNVSVVEGEVEPVDVVLVLDYSGSMKTYNIDESDPTSITRLAALKNAALLFLQQLEASNNTTDPHRVAFILYGDDVRLYYNNNGSLDYAQGTTYNYETAVYTPEICSKAFFSYGDAVEALKPNSVWNSIKDINTLGGTEIGKAINVADYVLAQNTGSSHKKFVITLTDGAPGTEAWSADDNCDVASNMTGASARMANYCLEKMHAGTTGIETKYDAKSYTIGIFSGANDSYTTLPTYYPNTLVDGIDHNGEYLASNINRFMNLLSSNSVATNLCDANNTWNNNHYYLSATDAEELNEIFKGIASAIGGASADLSSQTIVQDVMSSQFAIPEGTTASNISVQTMDYIGTDPAQTTSWNNLQTLANPNIQFSEDGKTIMVTGFDYASNWVGADESTTPPTYHGKKLIVTIPIEFDPSLTDDDVFHGTFATNAAGSGIYDADGMPVGNFPTPTTNVDHGKVTWVQKVTTQPSGFNAMEINTANELAWFISLVNGMNGQTAQPGLNGKLTGDIDMSANIWVPIGYNSAHKYTGTFDGNGYTVSGIIIPSKSAADYVSWRFDTGKGSGTDNTIGNDSASYYAMGTKLVNEGFFGYTHGATINNLFLTGGTLVTDTIKNVTLGGLVGRAVSTTITFTESAINLVDNGTNDTIGGLIGSSRGTSAKAVMVMGDINANGKAANTLGAIVGYDQLGTIVATFFTNHTISNDDNVVAKNKIGSNGYVRVANEGYDNVIFTPDLFSETKPYEYGNYSTNNTIGTTPLVDRLNQGLGNDEEGVYKWIRPAGANINGDYPIIVKTTNDGFAVVNDDEDGKVVRYGDINELIAMEKYQSTDHSIFMYNNDELTNAPVNTKLYIDQNVAMTQSSACGPVNAYVSVTMDNSSMHSSKADTDPTRDWHGFASTIEKGQIGINYGTQTPGYGELGAGAYSFIHNDTVYLPNGVTGPAVDIYAFYEPQYHWINLKRAGNNHWKQDSTSVQIHYNGGGSTDSNETTYTPGKGYFVALGDAEHDNNFMQAYGTLNNSEAGFTVPITNTGAHLKGYNLLGNPFQSYLDFNEFAEVNKNIWAGTSSMGYYSYLIYDADKGGFREYLTDGSQSFSQNAAQDAPRYINMHQAFFVVKDGTLLDAVTFKNSMRRTDTTGMGSITFRDAQPAYPLVNLFCTDSEGKQEISVIELNRPKMAGSLKMKGMLNAKGNMYIHWGSEDFGSMFIDHMPDYVPVWFDAAEDGVFTMSWNTQNAAFGYVHFVDNMTGADIDCLEADSYTFESHVTDMSARFRLVFKPLGIEEETAEQGENFAFFNGSELVVNGEGELSLIDLNGRVLTTQYVSGQQSYVTLPNVAMGMYMLRLTRANDVKVQKIVIRK